MLPLAAASTDTITGGEVTTAYNNPGGTLNLNGAVYRDASITTANLNLFNASLTNVPVTLTGTLAVQGGTGITDSTLSVKGLTVTSGTSNGMMGTSTLTLQSGGPASSIDGNISLSGNSTALRNYGTLSFTSGTGTAQLNGSGMFTNYGTATVSGSGAQLSSITANNAGTFNVNGATFYNTSVFTNQSGANVAIGSGGTLNTVNSFRNDGTMTIQSGGSFTGTGGTIVINGTVSNAGAFSISGGNPTLNGAISGTGTVSLGNASITLNNTTTIANPTTLTPSAYTGSGQLRLTGTSTVQSGVQFSGTGAQLRNDGTMTIDGQLNGGSSSDAVRFINNGTITHTGSSPIAPGPGEIFANNSGATLNLQSSGTQFVQGMLNNAGTLNVGSALNTVTVASAQVSNSGTVNVAGVVQLGGTSFTQTAGTTKLAAGSTLQSPDYAVAINGGTLKGTGTVQGNLNLGSAGTLAPGQSPGQLTVNGNLVFASGATYQVELAKAQGAVAGVDSDFLSVSGSLQLPSSGLNLNIASFGGGMTGGLMSNFDTTSSYNWTIASALGGITGLTPSTFNLVTAGIGNAFTGTWGVSQLGNDLVLNYFGGGPLSPVPEASTYLSGGALLCAWLAWRRRRQQAAAITAPRLPER